MPYFGKLYIFADYQLDYLNLDPLRAKALIEFDKFAQEIINKGLRHHTVDSMPIKVFNGSRRDFDGLCPFNLDLHGFRKEEGTIVLERFLTLIDKFNIPSFTIIHGKSGDNMFNITIDCLQKIRHKIEEIDCQQFDYEHLKERRRSYKSGETYIKFKNRDRQAWPACEQYYFDKQFRAEVDKRHRDNEIRATQTISENKTKSSDWYAHSQPTYSYQSQAPPKATPGGGFFATIGGFIKAAAEGISEGISEAAEAARLERERIARQQEKYNTLYESKRGVISKGYSSIKKICCAIHVLVFFVFVCSLFLIIPLWFFNLIFNTEVLNHIIALMWRGFTTAMNEAVNHRFYILAFYGVTLILGVIYESRERKKFYSMVPKKLHHEVEFRFF